MCDWFTVVLALLVAALAVFLIAFGGWLAFRPHRYLRFFANTRMEVYRSRGWTEEEINYWTRGSLIQRFLGGKYSEWLKDAAERPEGHKRTLLLIRTAGILAFLIGLVIGLLWIWLVFYNIIACLL